LPPLDEFLRQLLGDWDARATSLGLAPRPDLAFVCGLFDFEQATIRIKAIPSQTKQLTWPDGIGLPRQPSHPGDMPTPVSRRYQHPISV
jgi:hypothetical protein